jgi:hypothetical protein
MLWRRYGVITPLLCGLVWQSATMCGDEPAGVKEAVGGAWERTVTTPDATYHFVKSHLDGKTTLQVTDSDGAVVESKTSEYRLSETHEVRIFTYFNNVITGGPNAGARVPGEFSYIYRIDGDRFYEIRGLLKDDDGPVEVLVWDRVQQATD